MSAVFIGILINNICKKKKKIRKNQFSSMSTLI